MFNALLSRSFDGIALTDRASRRLIEVSGSFCDMTGFARTELVGRTAVEAGLVPDDRRVGARLDLAEGEEAGLYRRVLRAKDGHDRNVELSHTLLADGALVLTVVRDVTESERQLAQLAFQGAIAETMAEGVALIRADDGVLVYTNGTFDALFGYEHGELLGQGVEVLNAPAEGTPEETAAAISAVLRREGVWRGEIKHVKKDGTQLWCSANVATIEHPDFGTVWISVHTDITARKQAEEQFRHLLEGSPDAQFVIDQDARIVLANARADELFGYPPGGLLGERIEKLVPVERRADHVRYRTEYLAEPRSRPMGSGMELFGCRKDGSRFPVEVSLSPLVTDQQLRVSSTVRDISERLAGEEARARLAAIVASSGDAVVGLRPDGRIDSWNLGAELLYGYRPDEAIGQHFEMLIVPELAESRVAIVSRVLETGTIEQLESEDVRKDGSRVAVALTFSPIRGRDGVIVGAARIARDITERKRFEHELQFFADHDPLTGLFNRRHFAEELGRHAAYAARFEDPAALVVADLDNFKYVNDTLGHKAGDDLIRGVARVLANRVRRTDVLARLGGDEFAVLLPRTDLTHANLLAEDLRVAVHDYKTVLNRQTIRCTVSIGVAPMGRSGEESLAAADMAMYAAKRQGRDRVSLAGVESGAFQSHLSWSERLHEALDKGRFELYAQPIVEMATGTVSQYELLLRLHDEHGQVLAPAEFIYTAERLGIIREIDRWVVRQALRLLVAGSSRAHRYAVNVSGVSMADEGLFQEIEDTVSRKSVDASRMTFEITETAAIADLDLARDFVGHLARLGCTTALDDFGSGFGSFSYLKRLPVDFIKIDGDFVGALPGSRSDQTLVKAIVDVGHGLGKQTVAEHVSSSQAFALLRSYGVEYAQGFYLGKPVPSSTFSFW